MRICALLFCATLLMLLTASLLTGCRTPPALPPEGAAVPPDVLQEESNTPDPYVILDQMVTSYRRALAYSDRATIHIIGTVSPSAASPSDAEPVSWNCTVAFQRPNRLRLEIYEGLFVADGVESTAQILSLPGQILRFPSPEQWTLETLFGDVHIDDAMQLGLPPSVLRFPPQLILLFANNPLNTFIPRGASVQWLEQQPIGQTMCDVIQVSHIDGSRILWVSQENNALRRMDYQPVGLPVPEGFDRIEAIRIEMTDAQFDGIVTADLFQFPPRPNAVPVAAFQSAASGLPTAEEHRNRLKLMTDSDVYRLVHQRTVPSEHSLPTKSAPRTFTLSQLWTQPLAGVDTMAALPDIPPKLLIPCEGNVVAVTDLQGNVLQRFEPSGLGDTIIMNIQVNTLPEKRRIGIITLGSRFYLYDESFNPLSLQAAETDAGKPEFVRDFLFFPHNDEELLLLAIQQNGTGIIRAFDLQGAMVWEHPLEGEPKQVTSAVVEGRNSILVSQTASQDSIGLFYPDGTALEAVEIPFGRYVVWFHMLDSAIYTIWENMDTGDIRFLGLDGQGKSQWSRLLPTGDYEVYPVYVPGEKKWILPLPNGEFFVFDTIGNLLDTFSLNVVPTGLLCLEVNGEIFLIIADGETVTAWQMR